MSRAIDLRKVLTKAHEGKWVALSENYKKVIKSSKDILVVKRFVDKTHKKVIYMKVPTAERAYANFHN